MDPFDNAVSGSAGHQAKDEEIWKKVIKELKLDDQSNCQKEHLDLCCGDGRLILKVFLSLSNKFKHYTGVDFSTKLTNNFEKILANKKWKGCKDLVDVVYHDVLSYDSKQKKFGLISACWCLGFFTKDQQIKLLNKIKSMLDKDGIFLLKESVKADTCKEEGDDHYTSLTLQNFEELMKEVGMFH